jgi:hypothetical protein
LKSLQVQGNNQVPSSRSYPSPSCYRYHPYSQALTGPGVVCLFSFEVFSIRSTDHGLI